MARHDGEVNRVLAMIQVANSNAEQITLLVGAGLQADDTFNKIKAHI